MLVCTFLWLPRKQQCLLPVLQQDWARHRFQGSGVQPRNLNQSFPSCLLFPKALWLPGACGLWELLVQTNLTWLPAFETSFPHERSGHGAQPGAQLTGQPTMLSDKECAGLSQEAVAKKGHFGEFDVRHVALVKAE